MKVLNAHAYPPPPRKKLLRGENVGKESNALNVYQDWILLRFVDIFVIKFRIFAEFLAGEIGCELRIIFQKVLNESIRNTVKLLRNCLAYVS